MTTSRRQFLAGVSALAATRAVPMSPAGSQTESPKDVGVYRMEKEKWVPWEVACDVYFGIHPAFYRSAWQHEVVLTKHLHVPTPEGWPAEDMATRSVSRLSVVDPQCVMLSPKLLEYLSLGRELSRGLRLGWLYKAKLTIDTALTGLEWVVHYRWNDGLDYGWEHFLLVPKSQEVEKTIIWLT